MRDKSANQQIPAFALQQFTGKGHLRCQHGRCWDSEFEIIRLLNGRLQIRAVPDVKHSSSTSWNEWLKRCEPFALEGEDGNGVQISAEDVAFTRTNLSLPDFRNTLIGYAQSVVRGQDREPDTGSVTIECELSNFRTNSCIYPVTIQVEEYGVDIGRRSWLKWGEIAEHSNAYRHATISAYLRIQNAPIAEEERALECLHGIASLLSIAGRGHVFLAAHHRFDEEKQWLNSRFAEPVYTARGWLRPLIPAEALGDFLTTAYPHLVAKYRNLELGNVIDHYLQALTLYSVWPLSLGVFTAMETLKAAFFRQAGDEEAQFWVPPADFEADEGVLGDLISVLSDHFPRFFDLSSGERQSLKAQLKGLNRRSYKHQLQTMLDQLGVSYSRKELQPFIQIRNRIIHQGVPVQSGVPIDDYERGTSRGWQRVQAAASLFERALLAVLGYSGRCELFDGAEGANQDE